MNDFKMTADAYRQAKKRDPRLGLDSEIKTLDFLATVLRIIPA